MDWVTRQRVLGVVTTCAWIGAAAGFAVAYYFDWWSLMWGTGSFSLPSGTYPRILLLVMGLVFVALPAAAGIGVGAALGAIVGYIAGRALVLSRHS